MSESFHFQSIILHLQQFWAEQGCIIWQPYYTQVGAGTYNPATFLRVLGPEPWHVAYVEPSIRPDDGRYGENPNRLQQHYQFQVILKPDPGNPQELYLRSLQAIGIDPHKHDIRFVEDNWESPALGAWGLGWEVWLDGQEITQFTYFQQAGGILVDPVAVEMTYGLERIAMPLQGVRNFKDIRWSPERTYGDVNLQGEREHSRYYFEAADVERVRKMYDLFEAEAISALENGLVLPAHDYVLKCSHTFNILDSRGAVGITERQALFGRMRDLSRRVAEAYRVQREGMGFPWIKETPILHPAVTPSVKPGEHTLPTEPANLLFEVGTEELPVADLASALEQLKERLPALLEEQRLEHGSVKVLGTPRRLTVLVEEVAPRQPDREVVVKGPPAARAFDGEGKPTPAGIGFARGKGLEPSDLQMREMDGGQYAVAVIQEKGSTAMEILSEALPLLIAGLKFEKTMRWNASGVAFSRPIRWILALLGGKVIPFAYAGLVAGNQTRGLRFHDPEEMQVGDATSYLKALAAQGILLDPTERKEAIREGVAQAMKAAGGTPQVEEALLEEVTELVEAPAIFSGTFDPTYLRLPAEVLVSVMKKHQRYFPVQDAKGELLPCFIGVRNGNGQNLESVAEGNAQVILARFADADFFIKEDLQHKLEEYLPWLATLTFQFKLGSMLDKSKRIESLVEKLAPRLGLTEAETKTAERAAHLCKADLATHMVIEMTSLQGSMGKYYALQSGETPEVAQAIAEHYLPRGASKPGLVVGLADRLDSLCGLFAAGLAPTGTKDPFAQRRGALAILQSLTTAKLDFNLRAGLEEAAALQPIPVTAEAINACLEFINGRLQAWLLEQDWRYDVVAAVLPAQGINPARAVQAVEELSTWVKRPDWEKILAAYARCVRITRDQKESFTLDPHVFTDPAEKALFDALLKVEATPQRAGSMNVTLNAFLPAIPAINQFFDSVMVMVEDEIVRKNRLALLQRIAALAEGIADFSQLEGF